MREQANVHALSRCDSGDSARRWRKSSRSYGAGNCVEVAPNCGRVEVRDSTDTHDAVLGELGPWVAMSA
jgi:hypothetical protein